MSLNIRYRKLEKLNPAQRQSLEAQLGSMGDFSLALHFGVKPSAVKKLRKSLAIAGVSDSFQHSSISWTKSKIARLGTVYDTHLAREWEVRKGLVTEKRNSLGIPMFKNAVLPTGDKAKKEHIWKPEEIALLGTDFDTTIATKIGLAPSTVTNYRNSLGIDPFSERGPLEWSTQMLNHLGEVSDQEFAEYFGISYIAARCKRILMDIPNALTGELTPLPKIPAQAMKKLGKVTDQAICKQYNSSRYIIRMLRQYQGIPIFDAPPKNHKYQWSPAIIKQLGKADDRTLAHKFNIPKRLITRKRNDLGIPLYNTATHINWTPAMLKQLPLMAPGYFAQAFKVDISMVRKKLAQLNLPSHSGAKKWLDEELALIGTDTDVNIAKVLALNTTHVRLKRNELGIPSFRPSGPFNWRPHQIALLGKHPDVDIAYKIGIHPSAVFTQRARLGISRYLKA